MYEEYTAQFIGREVEITGSRNPTYTGISGRVIDETRNTLLVGHGNRSTRIPKKSVTFRIMPEGTVINGRYVCLTPEERMKQFRRIERAIRKGEEL